MSQRIWSEDLQEYLNFPDSMSDAEIESEITKLVAQERGGTSASTEDVEVGASLKHGLKSGVADLVDSAGDYIDFAARVSLLDAVGAVGEKIGVPDAFARTWHPEEILRTKAKEYKESTDQEFTPGGLGEKVLSGVAAAPGTIAGMAPALAATALVAPVTGPYAPAIGFGLHGAVRGAEEGPAATAKGAAFGAAEGLAFGGLGKALSPLKSVAMKKLLHAAGGAGIGGTSSAAHQALETGEVDPEDAAANAAVLGLLGLVAPVSKKKTTGQPKAKTEAAPEDGMSYNDRSTIGKIEAAKKTPGARLDPGAPIDLERLRETEGGTKPPDRAVNWERLGSEESLENVVRGEIAGILQRPEPMPRSRQAEVASDVVDYESAMSAVEHYIGGGIPEGRMGGVLAKIGDVAEAYHKTSTDLLGKIESAEISGNAELASRLGAQFEQVSQRSMILEGSRRGYLTEAARVVNMGNRVRSGIDVTDEMLMKAQRDPVEAADLYRKFLDANSEGQRDALVKAKFDPKWSDKAHEAWIMGMLSNPLTWVVNLTSNTVKVPLRWGSEMAGVGYDVARSAVTGKPRAKTSRDVRARVVGAKEAAPHIWNAAKDMLVWKTYINDLKSPLTNSGKLEIYGPKIGGQQGAGPLEVAAGSLARTPGRVLQIGDNIFRTLNEFEEAYAMASERSGKSASMKDISKLAKDLLKEDSEGNKADIIRIKRAGDRAVFTDPLAKQEGLLPQLGSAAQKGKMGAAGPLVKWGVRAIAPFTRTPTNIMIDALRHSPFGAIELRRMVKSGASQQEIASQVGSMLVGSSMMGIIAYWADQGVVTGGGPSDPRAYMAWRAAGNQPYSIRLTPLSDKWYSYQRVEPLASIFGIAADTVELAGVDNPEERIGRAVSLVKDNLANKTYMMGVENLTKAWADPKRYGENWAETMVGSLIPAVSGAAARLVDPIDRRQSGPVEAMMARIPGQREKLGPKYTVTGEISRRDHPIASTLTPFSPVDVKPERVVEAELARLGNLGYSIPGLPRRTKKVVKDSRAKAEEMTQEEYAGLMEWTRRATGALKPIISAPSWKNLDEETKVKIIKSIYEKYREPGHYSVAASMRKRLRAN